MQGQIAEKDGAYHLRDPYSMVLCKTVFPAIHSFITFPGNNRELLQVHFVLKEALKLLRATLPTTIEIRESIDTGCGNVLSNPTQTHQIVMNLCTNGYQAMYKTGGILSVELTQVEIETGEDKVTSFQLTPGSYILLKISDTCIGISQENIERIFEPFFTTKTVGEGTGMGLAVVHGIVKSHGGHITVYSEPGKGTTVHVYLPRIVTAVSGTGEQIEEVLPTGNERILVVDDEKTLVEIEQRILEHLGYKVTAVSDNKEALEIFYSHPENFDLIITDMTMPHLTGTEFSQKIIKVRPNIPIILCTGFSALINKEKAQEMGIKEYVMKPVLLADIAKIVRKVLDAS